MPPARRARALWSAGHRRPALAAELARHHRHGAGRIAHLGRLARHRAALDGRTEISADDLLAASWIGEGSGLDALAQPLPTRCPTRRWSPPPALRPGARPPVLRCVARDGLADGLGISASTRYRPGVRALFIGPSGTGKTLAAGWLATRLGCRSTASTCAGITSKYIGETEKNLAQLLARAEQAEVVLLFDEADSLFGKRTDVRDANDRFANAQTNYLLQRIESFDGIAILTTNSRARFDAAFARRLDAIVDFPLPGPRAAARALAGAPRRRSHALTVARPQPAGGGAPTSPAATSATPCSPPPCWRSRANRAIAYADLVDGVANEYRKLGRQMPVELLRT